MIQHKRRNDKVVKKQMLLCSIFVSALRYLPALGNWADRQKQSYKKRNIWKKMVFGEARNNYSNRF